MQASFHPKKDATNHNKKKCDREGDDSILRLQVSCTGIPEKEGTVGPSQPSTSP